MERIRKNVDIVKKAYTALTQVPANLDYMTIDKANDIERILFEIDYILAGMENNFIYCGVPNCGQERAWQQRFRKPKTWNAQPYKLSQFPNTDTLKMIATDNNIVFESENQEYKSYTLKNIIGDSSFEKDEWANANYSTTEKLFGNRSLFFPSGTTVVAQINIKRPIAGHKYYGRRYMKTNGDNQPADRRFEMWGGDGTNFNWVFALNMGNYPEWQFDASIQEIVSVNYPIEKQTIIRCFNVNTTADTWIDGLMIIDLTESFGVGNEPTKEWCDENIPYFDGEYTLKIPQKAILVQLDKRDDVYASVQAINDSMQAVDDLVGYECEFYTLTNLLKPIENEDFMVDGGSVACEKSTTHVKYGSNSLLITGDAGDNEKYGISTTNYPLEPTHLYYARVEVYSETGVGTYDFFWKPASPSFFGGKNVYANTWIRWSVVANRSSFTAGNYPYRLDYNNGGVADKAWFDGAMIIDLTEAFGAGNEPTHDWCDRNIPYFSGTQTIKIRKESA